MSTRSETPAKPTPPEKAPAGSFVALMAVGAVGGALLGGILGASAAAMLADGLDLGQVKDRLAFVIIAALIGAPTGLACALWPILRARRPLRTGWRGALGFTAWAGLAGLTLHAFAFAASTPPPPVTPYLHVEVRVSPGAGQPLVEDDTALSVYTGRDGRGPAALKLAKDTGGRDLVRGSFWMSRQAPVESLRLRRRGKPEVRFTLNLPSDPPSTGDFTQWLAADRVVTAGDETPFETIELRFRIDRRVAR